MESLSSIQAGNYWPMDQQDLFTIPRSKAKTSDYETGFSAAEYDEDEDERYSENFSKVRLDDTWM